MPTNKGALKLFKLAGIQVYLHWSWFLIAVYEILGRKSFYASPVWNAIEYLSLFALVLMHEFGHALACRSVGGRANEIILWPLGGVAYVAPPERPGATLWSIAAGPLVNVALMPVLIGLWFASPAAGLETKMPDLFAWVQTIAILNVVIMVFNLLPIYPLDGGQILRSVLWFMIGRARSLAVASSVGFVGVAGLFIVAWWAKSEWIAILAVFMVMNCWRGLNQARLLARMEDLPRHTEFECPSCHKAPMKGPHWLCANCQTAFDMFAGHAVCPRCGAYYASIRCFDCGVSGPISEWTRQSAFVPGAREG
ncbi:MAG: M50 family metallopeptidase [Verrucomicrobiota bacterium]|nr:M50 family metallopeptidase [Verrucomicrobiota bacterium]